ncbi:hypothetical protein PDESU_00551 [Pontiella desulfatans]|uniref:Uncharacterized protein n=1 Tax=Pontiella desulfatans TaxID=2750659 RepID=A0A6C2TWM9_PONDE|nr:hypothetical protein [Pontiella desulfatans]VGO12003.1 hypothetical protein PDESU_00551 [Pontiella desulfatans]
MKKSAVIKSCILLTGICAIGPVYADFVSGPGGGSVTESNNWSKGVFDPTENPVTVTSTGDNEDLIGGDRIMYLLSDFATFNNFSLGATSNTRGGHLVISNGTFTAENVRINQNTGAIADACTLTQLGGTANIGVLNIGLNTSGEATYTVAGGILNVTGSINFTDGQENQEHTLEIDGQGASSITVGGDVFLGAGTGIAYQNIRFNLGPTGITPLQITGSIFADEQSEYIIDGANYTGGENSITLLTAGNFFASQSNSVTVTFLNFNDYIPSLSFVNKELTLTIIDNPYPELLEDPSFESLVGSEPNSNSVPWFTIGEEGGNPNFSVITETVSSNVLTGSTAVKFNYYFDKVAVVQNTGLQIAPGEFFELSVAKLITEPSSNTGVHVNASSVNLTVWTSDNAESNYVYRIGSFGNLVTNENEYQQFVFPFSTADLIDNGAEVGDYMQIRIAKANENATHRIVIDDASFKQTPVVTNSYASWASDWGVDIGAESEDYDHDGLINLYEYGLGGNPTNGFVNGNLPTFGKDGADFGYVYAQRSDDPTLTYYLGTDDDLVAEPGWTNSGYTVEGTNVTGGTFDEVTNSIPTADPQKFIRLFIEN